MEKISSSTLLLYVFDVGEMTIPEVQDDLSRFSRDASKLIVVVNKIDKGLPAEKVLPLDAFPSVAFVSSLNRENIDSLRQMMFEKIAGEQTNLESAVVTNARHVEVLKKTKAILKEVTDSIHQKESGELTALHLRRALQHLGEITGEVTTDDLLENIFSKFCIGK